MPRSAAVALVVLAALVFSAPASALPPQGVYEQCLPAQPSCRAHLNRIAADGFKLVLNYRAWEARPAQLRAYARKAQSLGLELILPLNHPVWRAHGSAVKAYPALAQACRCRRNSRLLRYALHLGDGLPAVWGWYIGDQLLASEAPRVQGLVKVVRAIDPNRPRLYISYRGPGMLLPLGRFADAATALGLAVYPVGLRVPLETVGKGVAATESVARPGTIVAAALQAFDWRSYGVTGRSQWPTVEEMRTMRDLAVAGGAQLLLWYSWQDLERSPSPALREANLVAAAFGQAA